MRKVGKLLWSGRIRLGVMTLALMVALGFANEHFSFVSHAESKGKVTASSSVNIRKEASKGSSVVGSAEKDASVDIKGQVTAADGSIWYQVFVDANTLGYIRSDLVQITDGTTPPTVSATTTTTTAPTQPETPAPVVNETPVAVTAVQPLSATVANGQKVRVRSNASTTSTIVTSAERGLAVTVNGQATGTDGNVWYQVNFISNGTEVTGFIRADYLALSGEVTPLTAEPPVADTPVEEQPVPEQPVAVQKDWDTQLQGDKWYLIDNLTPGQYDINMLITTANTNAKLYEESQKTVGSQKIAIIILVIFVIALGAFATMLFLKIKDMTDSAYFSEVEKETLRKRNDNKPQGDKRIVHTVGPDKKQGVKPQGVKPSGVKPQGARPAGAPQGARPAGAPQGQRPAGAPQGQRPAGAPQGQRPVGAPQGQRPVGAPQGQRPVGAPQGQRPAGAPPQGGKPAESQGNPGWKSKNFMTDDDEFEFEFLNWDGEEE